MTWPCPAIGDTGDACKSAFWPDGDSRRTNGDVERSYKKKPDTMACRFYDRFARRSPCERGALKIWLQDPQRQRMPYAPYRLEMGNVVRTGNADSNGLVTVFMNTGETTATLMWGQVKSSASSSGDTSAPAASDDQPAFLYARQLIINDSPPDPLARDYFNLHYWQTDANAQLQAFQGDYGDSKGPDDVADTHLNGTPKPENA